MIGDQIPSEVQHALRSMRDSFEGEADVARREYVRKCLKNHEFFRGNAWYWWDYGWGSYRSFIGNAQIGDKMLEQVQSLYVVNIFQPFALALISLLASNKLTQKFWPFDPNDPGDVAAAKKHDVVFRAFQKGERRHDQLVKAIYHLWCDGTFGSYVRTVQDAERFGYLEEPEYQIQQVPIGNGTWRCPICEHQQAEGGACQACEAPLPAQPNVPAPVMSRQKKVGTKKIARAQVARDVVGGLELKLPPMAEAQHAYPYLIRSRELPRSSVRAAYPELASKIVGSSSPADGSSTGNYERRARIQASGGSTVDGKPTVPRVRDIVTFTEVWFRKTAFYQIDDERVRGQMLEMFPNGAYCSFADDLLCEVRDESMDDHWRVCHALPGRGQLREPIGAALVPLQEMINDLANIFRDIIEFGIPATFIDKQVLDVESWQRSRVMGGAAYNVTRRGQTPVQDGFFQTAPGSMPEYATRFFDLLRTDLAQFVTGTFSAAMGGDTGGNNALDVDTPIPTPRGFVRNGDLADGDEVFGEDGNVWSVVKAHPVQHKDALRVVFDDGSSVIADPGHRWWTANLKEREAVSNRTEKRRAQIRASARKRRGDAFLGASRGTGPKPTAAEPGSIKTTAEIMATLLDKRGRSNHATPIAEPFAAPEAYLFVDPYVLGAWLGDGNSANGGMACSDADAPHMAAEFGKAGFSLHKIQGPNRWYADGLRKQLRLLGVLGDKHIPDAYLWASPGQRLALLQGLMDTDGCATEDGKQFFSNRNRSLIDGVFHLAASLGAKPRIIEMTTGAVTDRKTGKVYPGGRPIWVVRWTAPLAAFRMKRKLERVKIDTVANKRKYRYIIAIEPAGERDVRCITVSNPTELYQFGKHFGVCANTAQGIETQRNAALSRISIFLQRLSEHYADFAPLVIREFRKSGVEPMVLVDQDRQGKLISEKVTPQDLRDSDARVIVEVNEEYPTTWPQKQALLMQLMGMPLFQSMVTLLTNADSVKSTLGFDLKMPGFDAYQAEFRIIRRLLAEAPIDGEPQPVLGPDGQPQLGPDGQPQMEPGPQQPSIPVMPYEDNASMLQACQDFYYSQEGREAQEKGTPGWQNFLLHFQARQEQAQPPAPPPGEAPPGEGPPPSA